MPSYETPNGSFRTFRMEADHYSKEFDDAPMPHSIFFTKIGHAIHGTDSVNRLGSPASHGCVRLSRANAATLYALVEEQGVLNTTVTLTGSSQVALARNPRGRANTAVARRAPAEVRQQYDNAGDPIVITPQVAPHARRSSAPTTATSIPPTAAATSRCTRRRAASMARSRSIRRSSNITTIAAIAARQATAPAGLSTAARSRPTSRAAVYARMMSRTWTQDPRTSIRSPGY